MISGRSRLLPPLSTDPASAPVPTGPLAPATTAVQAPTPVQTSRQTLALPVAPVVPVAPTAAAAPRPLTPPRRTPPPNARHRHHWPRLAVRVLILPALLFVVLVPPQSLRATLVTLLIVVALGLVVWRLPMGDEE